MSHEKQKTTVESFFASELPYLVMREMRERKMTREEFASHCGISVEQLDEYRTEGGCLPRSDTLLKMFSKCSIEFLADVIATAGISNRYSIISNQNKPETGISIVAKGRAG